MIMEEWKDIDGYNGDYQISNFGRVKSIERYVDCLNGVRRVDDKVLKSSPNKTGYYSVTLYKDKIKINHLIHHLVWDNFSNNKRNGHILEVDHIVGDKSNNRFDNLQLLVSRNNKTKSIDKTKTSSKYIGVVWRKRTSKWESNIRICGKRKYLGSFNTEIEAHLAYQNEKNKI